MEIKVFRNITRKIGEFQVRHPFGVLVAALIFTILLFPGLFLVRFDNDNENFLPENDPTVEALFVVETSFSGDASLQLLFFNNPDYEGESIDLRDPDFLKRAHLAALNIKALEYVDSVTTPTSILKEQNNGVMPSEISRVKEIVRDNPQIASFFNEDFSYMRMSINAPSFGNDSARQREIMDELKFSVESVGLPHNVKFQFWGSLIQFLELDKNMASDMGLTTGLAFFLIFLLILIFYRSFVSAVFSIAPIAISLLWTIGTMGYIDLPFTVLTTGFIPLVMGLGIDFSIHLIHSIQHLKSEGKKIEDAVIETMEEIGEAIAASTLTTSLGFLSLVLASLLITQRLGQTLTLSVFFIFVGCIVLIPAVLVLQERLLKKP